MTLDANTAALDDDGTCDDSATRAAPSDHVDRIVCRCLQVRQSTLSQAIRRDSLRTVDAITAATGAGGACTACHKQLRQLLADAHGDPTLAEAPRRRGTFA